MDWLKALLEAIQELFGLGRQLADNQGRKIPLKEDAIRERARRSAQRAANKAKELKQDGVKDDWLHMVDFYAYALTTRNHRHARKQVKRLIDAGLQIVDIELESRGEKNYLRILYKDKDVLREYLIDASKRNVSKR